MGWLMPVSSAGDRRQNYFINEFEFAMGSVSRSRNGLKPNQRSVQDTCLYHDLLGRSSRTGFDPRWAIHPVCFRDLQDRQDWKDARRFTWDTGTQTLSCTSSVPGPEIPVVLLLQLAQRSLPDGAERTIEYARILSRRSKLPSDSTSAFNLWPRWTIHAVATGKHALVTGTSDCSISATTRISRRSTTVKLLKLMLPQLFWRQIIERFCATTQTWRLFGSQPHWLAIRDLKREPCAPGHELALRSPAHFPHIGSKPWR